MALKVIGAGFGRTGTFSLKLALEQLGFGPCYHGVEVLRNPQTAQWWIDAADGRPDWAKIFMGKNSTVDWPSCTFYAELADAYPEAKVILTERDPEAWFTSTQNTIFPHNDPPDTGKPFDIMTRKIIAPLFDFRMREHDNVVDAFKRHSAEVRRRIAPKRLLVYEVAQGWEPLCRFLDVPIPATPMPKKNTTEDFATYANSERRR
ncbi:MAG TPA: sulfotransferase [Rhizomicrobium sp.]|jgi:hypothetical protein